YGTTLKEQQSMRRMARASGARLPVPRQPLNLSERHFSSITRNPTQTHSHLAIQCGQSRFTTLGSSGLRARGERLIRIQVSEASRVGRQIKNRTKSAHEPGQPARSDGNACQSERTISSR